MKPNGNGTTYILLQKKLKTIQNLNYYADTG